MANRIRRRPVRRRQVEEDDIRAKPVGGDDRVSRARLHRHQIDSRDPGQFTCDSGARLNVALGDDYPHGPVNRLCCFRHVWPIPSVATRDAVRSSIRDRHRPRTLAAEIGIVLCCGEGLCARPAAAAFLCRG
jgi:hypothetical protein